MILRSLKRNDVADDKLWEMIDRANKLTKGSYGSWDNHALVLVPLMKRILSLSKEREDWQVYFYDMAKLFWLIRRARINDIPLAFKLAEMFHQDREQHLGEETSQFARGWRVNLAAKILAFYLEYPQIDDRKIHHMLEIFLEYEEKYGSQWNYGDYEKIMRLAVLNKDKELARKAAKKLKVLDFKSWCYVCYYVTPMMEYYMLEEDFESVQELVLQVYEKTVPKKYQWSFSDCQMAGETIVYTALEDCLKYGNSQMFGKCFAIWRSFYENPQEEEITDTFEVLFHSLAGDWSKIEERLRLAENDDKDRRLHKETPLDCLYWSLCWYCYFQMLEKQGVKSVELELGEELPPDNKEKGIRIRSRDKGMKLAGNNCSGSKEDSFNSRKRLWSCAEASRYFEEQADFLGEQMGQARKNFGYEIVKKTFEESFIEKEITNEFSN